MGRKRNRKIERRKLKKVETKELGIWEIWKQDKGALIIGIAMFFVLFLCATGNATDLSGTLADWEGDTVTDITTYVYAFTLTGSGDSTQLANSAYAGSSTTSSSDGTWTITGLSASTEYLIVFIYWGFHKGYNKLAGAEFMTTP